MIFTPKVYDSQNAMEVMAAYLEAIDFVISLMKQENELIKTYSFKPHGHETSQVLLDSKKNVMDYLSEINVSLLSLLEENHYTKQHAQVILQKQEIFSTACAENFAYLKLAQTLNQRILGYFIKAHHHMCKHSYTADGLEGNQSTLNAQGALIRQST